MNNTNVMKITSRIKGFPGEFIFGWVTLEGKYIEYWDFFQNYAEMKREEI